MCIQFHLRVNTATVTEPLALQLAKEKMKVLNVKVNRNSKMYVRKIALIRHLTSIPDGLFFV